MSKMSKGDQEETSKHATDPVRNRPRVYKHHLYYSGRPKVSNPGTCHNATSKEEHRCGKMLKADERGLEFGGPLWGRARMRRLWKGCKDEDTMVDDQGSRKPSPNMV